MLGHEIPKTIVDKLLEQGDLYIAQENGKPVISANLPSIARMLLVDDVFNITTDTRAKMNQDNVIYALIDKTGKRCKEYFPEKYFENTPLEGRPFLHGIFDCFTIINDWFYREHNIDLLWNLQRPFGWWENSQSLYLQNAEAAGFIPQTGVMQYGDVLLFGLNTTITNHSAVYLGNNKILHHLGGRFSCEQLLTPGLNSYRQSVWRHKNI